MQSRLDSCRHQYQNNVLLREQLKRYVQQSRKAIDSLREGLLTVRTELHRIERQLDESEKTPVNPPSASDMKQSFDNQEKFSDRKGPKKGT